MVFFFPFPFFFFFEGNGYGSFLTANGGGSFPMGGGSSLSLVSSPKLGVGTEDRTLELGWNTWIPELEGWKSEGARVAGN